MKVVAIVQGRMGSARLPNKVMKVINGVPLLELLLVRLSKSKELDQIIVASPIGSINSPLVEHVKNFNTPHYSILKRLLFLEYLLSEE